MAPQSKIAFTDIGSGQTGSINAPANLATDYFLYTYNQ